MLFVAGLTRMQPGWSPLLLFSVLMGVLHSLHHQRHGMEKGEDSIVGPVQKLVAHGRKSQASESRLRPRRTSDSRSCTRVSSDTA